MPTENNDFMIKQMNLPQTELKPCPFCGGIARLYNQKVRGGYDYSYVICEACRIRTMQYEVSTEYCSRDKAINDWNRRVNNAK